jgi:hypothetical protein
MAPLCRAWFADASHTVAGEHEAPPQVGFSTARGVALLFRGIQELGLEFLDALGIGVAPRHAIENGDDRTHDGDGCADGDHDLENIRSSHVADRTANDPASVGGACALLWRRRETFGCGLRFRLPA